MKITSRNLVALYAVAAVLAIIAIALAPDPTFALLLQAFTPENASGLMLANGVAALTIDEIKSAVADVVKDKTSEHSKAMTAALAAIEAAKADVQQFKTLQTETNVKLTETMTKAADTQAALLETQQTLTKLTKGAFSPEEVKTIGQKVSDSDEWKAASKAGASKMDAVDIGSFWGSKAAIVNQTGTGQTLVPSQRLAMLDAPERPLMIRDLLPVGATESTLLEYVKENVFTNAAAIVYQSPAFENVTKPESALTFALANAPVVTIAHWIPASRQVLADAKMLRGYVENRLTYGVKFAEEDELLNGDGSAGHLDGLMHQASAYAGSGAVSADTQLDTLLRAMTQCWTASLFQPDGVVVSPIDWMKIRLIKDTQGRYIFGDPHSSSPPSVWGQRVVASLSIASTRFLVGAFQQGAQIWDRENATVRIAEQHADFFVKNMVAILAEERLALTVYRPGAFVRGNFN